MALPVMVAVPPIHSFCPPSKRLCFTKSKRSHFRLSTDNFEMRHPFCPQSKRLCSTKRKSKRSHFRLSVEEVENIEAIPEGSDNKIFIVDNGKRENLDFKEKLEASESLVQQMLTVSANWASTSVSAKPVALSTNMEVPNSGLLVMVEYVKKEWPFMILSLIYAGLLFKEPVAKIMIIKGFYIKCLWCATVVFLCTSKKIPICSHVRGYLAFEMFFGTRNLWITICKAHTTKAVTRLFFLLFDNGFGPTSFDPRNVASNFPANGLNTKSTSYDPRIVPSKFQAIVWNSKYRASLTEGVICSQPTSIDPRIAATNFPAIGLNSKVGMSYLRNLGSIVLVIIGILALILAGKIVWVALVGKQEVEKDDPGSSSSPTP